MILDTDLAYQNNEVIPAGHDETEYRSIQINSGWRYSSYTYYHPLVALLEYVERHEDLDAARLLVGQVSRLSCCLLTLFTFVALSYKWFD